MCVSPPRSASLLRWSDALTVAALHFFPVRRARSARRSPCRSTLRPALPCRGRPRRPSRCSSASTTRRNSSRRARASQGSAGRLPACHCCESPCARPGRSAHIAADEIPAPPPPSCTHSEATFRLTRAQATAPTAAATDEPDWDWLDQLLNTGRPASSSGADAPAPAPANDQEFFPGRELRQHSNHEAPNLVKQMSASWPRQPPLIRPPSRKRRPDRPPLRPVSLCPLARCSPARPPQHPPRDLRAQAS